MEDKPKRTLLNLDIDPDLKDQATERAKSLDRSTASYVRRLIIEDLRRAGEENNR